MSELDTNLEITVVQNSDVKKRKRYINREDVKYWTQGDGLQLVTSWCRDGMINEDIARKIGVTVKTLYVWKNKYEEFAVAITTGKEIVDVEVENALYRNTQGYYYTEEKHVLNKETGEMELVEKNKKFQKPDTTSQIFWLKNRKREQWREKQSIELENNVNVKADPLEDLSTEELRKLINMDVEGKINN